MKETKQNEKGAIIVEIIAVIALLGVLGPLLFKQVLSRNEEVENINIASEVRTIKEAFSAYILANKQRLLNECQTNGCEKITMGKILDFLPAGYSDDQLDYDLILDAVEPSDGSSNAKLFLQGFIIPGTNSLPSPLKMKRAARIANLIGADGGIYIGSEHRVYGTGGTWSLEKEDNEHLGLNNLIDTDRTAIYMATTGMDTYIPEVEYEDFDSANVVFPNDLALQKLHAWNYFSVGAASATAPNTCYQLNHFGVDINGSTATAKDDVIYGAGTTNNEGGRCDPLFWVGATNSSDDKSKAGHVYVKNALHIGHDTINGNSAVKIETNSDTDDNTKRRITVYDVSGEKKVTIDATGRLISYGTRKINSTDETETLTIQDGHLESNEYAPLATQDSKKEGLPENESENYRVDPAFTSVMNDIRLESRGGARLSDILPNYILKEVIPFTSHGESSSSFEKTIPMPNCPNNYAPAIIVIPTKWNSESITLLSEDLKSIANTLQTESASENANIKVKSDSVSAKLLETGKAGLGVVINSKNGIDKKEANATGEWTVRIGYKAPTDSIDQFTGMPVKETISAIAQTYCVFDNTAYNNDLPTKTNTNKPLERRKVIIN